MAAANTRLTKSERKDFVASLEHIVTVGCSKRDDAKRHLEQTHPVDKRLKHAEDDRLYESVPKQVRKDSHWDYEYGDSFFDLCSFYENSKRTIRQSRKTFKSHVPREIVLRCWERAMQAASNQIEICGDGKDEYSMAINESADARKSTSDLVVAHVHNRSSDGSCDKESNENDDSADFSIAKGDTCHVTTVTPDSAMQRCVALNIESIGTVCPRCEVTFDCSIQCHSHFYGTTSVLGCCWQLVKEKELALLRAMLEAEVKAVTNQLMDGVVPRIQSSEKLDWYQVISAFDDNEINSFLTPQVAKNTKRRIYQRYANLPF